MLWACAGGSPRMMSRISISTEIESAWSLYSITGMSPASRLMLGQGSSAVSKQADRVGFSSPASNIGNGKGW